MAKKKIAIIDDSDSSDEVDLAAQKSEKNTQKIKITHWDDEVDEGVEAQDPVHAEEDGSSSEDEPEVDKVADGAPKKTIQVTEVSDENEELEDAVDEEQDDEGHRWHKLDDETSEEVDNSTKDDETVTEVADVEPDDDQAQSSDDDGEETKLADSIEEVEDQVDIPGLEDEQYAHAKSEEIDSEDDTARPEWDEEKYAQANSEDEDLEDRPEWDEEKWKTAEATIADESDAGESDAESKEAASLAALGALADSVDLGSKSNKEKKLHNSRDLKTNLSAIKKSIKKWWNTPKLRNPTLAGALILLLIAGVLPTSRYAFLNTIGIRASASVSVVDGETKLPLRNVAVTLSGKTIDTNSDGIALFDRIKLGSQTVAVEKSAYDAYVRTVTVKTGSNTLEAVELDSIGSKFKVNIVDWLSGESIDGAEVSFGENSAFSDSEGSAQLTVPSNNDATITAVASAPGYSPLEVEIDATMPEAVFEARLVLERKHYFISKRSGTYDVFSSNLDGTSQELVLAGTGNEEAGLRFDISPSGEKLVLAAIRDKNIKNTEGFVLTGFYVIDSLSGELSKIDSSERVDIVGWIGDRVIYVKIQAGASGRNPQRHRLMSYNTQSGESVELAASNYFNDVLVAKNYVFFAPSDAYKQNPKPYLYRIGADGSNPTTVFERNVWTIIRSDFDTVVFDSEQTWYETDIVNLSSVELDGKPNDATSELYTDSPNGLLSARVDIRDGKGTLQLYTIETNEEEQFASVTGLRNPIVWMDDTHLIYRVVTSGETADYILSTESGEAKPISDVTNVSGADRWYYYY